jgi:multicomponent Na+:H+ antiporter subunit D
VSGAASIGVALATPLAAAALIVMSDPRPNQREGVTIGAALVLLLAVAGLVPEVLGGARPRLTLLEVAPGLALAFEVEPLGMIFALVASALWIVNSLYSIGYMRGNAEAHQTRFYACFAIATCSRCSCSTRC